MPAPGATEKVQTGSFESDCWGDLAGLQAGVGEDDLVSVVNMTVTCV